MEGGQIQCCTFCSRSIVALYLKIGQEGRTTESEVFSLLLRTNHTHHRLRSWTEGNVITFPGKRGTYRQPTEERNGEEDIYVTDRRRRKGPRELAASDVLNRISVHSFLSPTTFPSSLLPLSQILRRGQFGGERKRGGGCSNEITAQLQRGDVRKGGGRGEGAISAI